MFTSLGSSSGHNINQKTREAEESFLLYNQGYTFSQYRLTSVTITQVITFHHQFSSVQLLSHVRLFATPWITARQASLSITNSWSSLRLMSIETVKPSSHLILCRPLLILPPIPPSIRVFSNESTLRMRWPKYWSFSFSRFSFPTKDQAWSLKSFCIAEFY